MFKFDPDAIYSLDELREGLRGIVELSTFLERLGLKDSRIFKNAVFGWEILEASQRAEMFSEIGDAATRAAVARIMRPVKPRGGKAGPLQKLTAADARGEGQSSPKRGPWDWPRRGK